MSSYGSANGYHMPSGVGQGFSPKMKLTEHFRLTEFTRSQTAQKYDLMNIPREEAELANLRALAEHVLEPTRAIFGRYLIITSGFRCATLNRLIGGAITSQHLYGEAADFIIRGVPTFDAASAIAVSDIPFDQLIYETRERKGTLTQWMHVSHRRLGPNRGDVLTIHKSEGARTVLGGIQPRSVEVLTASDNDLTTGGHDAA